MRFSMKLIVLSLLSLTLGACAFGPKNEKKSKLNYLNGKHYQKQGSVLGVPFLKREGVATHISGQLQLKTSSLPLPLANKTLILKNENHKEVSRTQTKSDGSFSFHETINNGVYFIESMGSNYKLNQKINIHKYKIDNLSLEATEL